MLVSGMVLAVDQEWKNDPRRAAAVDQRRRSAAGLVPAGRPQPHRFVLPAESAVPVPGRAAGVLDSDEQLQRGPGSSAGAVVNAVTRSAPTTSMAACSATCAIASSTRRTSLPRAGLPEAQAIRRLHRRSDRAQQDVLLRRLAAYTASRTAHAEVIRLVATAAQRRGDFSSCVPACPQAITRQQGSDQISADL